MIRIERDKELKGLNTFGIAARAAGYAEFRGKADLDELFALPEWKERPWTVVGGGSNILPVGDYDGLILHPAADGIRVTGQDEDRIELCVEAGLEWDKLVAYCVERGYGGLENLSDIPGSVGACPVQNIGAYGVEVKDAVVRVEAYLVGAGSIRHFTAAECGFGYRESIFKREWKDRAIILSVTFQLSLRPRFNVGYGDLAREVESLGGVSLRNVREAVRSIRAAKLPDPRVLGNSGSFFKNPVVSEKKAAELKELYPEIPLYPVAGGVKLAAGWLIDRCGLKGFRQGNAGVHDRQALVLVNHGGASGNEILSLARHVIDSVERRFGLRLDMEVNLLGVGSPDTSREI